MRYRDAAAFRQALEQRLNARAAGDGARLASDRKRVAFDRLLARLNVAASDRWLLKGGFALDLRLGEKARATRDVDIEWQAAEEELLDALIEATSVDVGTTSRSRSSAPRFHPIASAAATASASWRRSPEDRSRRSCSMSACVPAQSTSTTL